MEETKPEVTVSVVQLDDLVNSIFDKKAEVTAQALIVTKMNKELSGLQAQAVKFLKELGRKKYVTDRGTLSITEKWRVNNPQTDEDKQAFFQYLRGEGLFDQMATVNNNSLNAYFKEAQAAADEAGDMLFQIPGIGEAKLFEAMKVTTAK